MSIRRASKRVLFVNGAEVSAIRQLGLCASRGTSGIRASGLTEVRHALAACLAEARRNVTVELALACYARVATVFDGL